MRIRTFSGVGGSASESSTRPTEAAVLDDHPLVLIRRIADAVLDDLSRACDGRRGRVRMSLGREKVLRALLIQSICGVSTERLLTKLHYDSRLRWFVGLRPGDPVWEETVFAEKQTRLLAWNVAKAFLLKALAETQRQGLLATPPLSIDDGGGDESERIADPQPSHWQTRRAFVLRLVDESWKLTR